jgi:hypothetical protein
METRQLKDAEGNVIVEITLPIGTSEGKWAEVLAGYSLTPAEETPVSE